MVDGNNRCMFCGEIIPEGRFVCWECDKEVKKYPKSEKNTKIKDRIFNFLR